MKQETGISNSVIDQVCFDMSIILNNKSVFILDYIKKTG